MVIQVIPRSSEAQDRGDQPTKAIYLPLVWLTSRAIFAKHKLKDVSHLSRSTTNSRFDLIAVSFAFGSAQSLGCLHRSRKHPVAHRAAIFIFGETTLCTWHCKGRAYGAAVIRQPDQCEPPLESLRFEKRTQLLRIAIGGQFERTKFNSNSRWLRTGCLDEAIRVSSSCSNDWQWLVSTQRFPSWRLFCGQPHGQSGRSSRSSWCAGPWRPDFHLTQTLSIRTSIAVTHETVVHDGIELPPTYEVWSDYPGKPQTRSLPKR